jgi:LTXXQ motif family protein
MRMLSKTIVALGLVALMAGPALAQQGRGGGGGRGGFGGGIGMLLSNASVQQELKLDATQIEKAKEVADKAREKFTASRESLQSLEGDARFKKMQELNKEVNEEANKAVAAFLSKDQIHRLHQIQHQVQGAQSFTDEHVQSRLKLTDAQKGEIDSIVQASYTEMHSLYQNMQSDPEGTRAKLHEHRKETLAKVESKLTDEQKTAYKEMLGAPFEIKYEPRSGGGGR